MEKIIYFVRHGHPDYKEDCLTELGRSQSQVAAQRLKECNLDSVFSSTCGRALETAEYTTKQYGLQVVPCDFMREIVLISPALLRCRLLYL